MVSTYVEWYSTPTMQKTNFGDDNTTRRRSLPFNCNSHAQQHLPFFETGSERPTGWVTMLIGRRNFHPSLDKVSSAQRGQVTVWVSTWCRNVHRQVAKDASWSAHGGMGLAAPKLSLLSSAPICYSSNMSEIHVLQGAQNVHIRDSTFITADTVCEPLWCLVL